MFPIFNISAHQKVAAVAINTITVGTKTSINTAAVTVAAVTRNDPGMIAVMVVTVARKKHGMFEHSMIIAGN